MALPDTQIINWYRGYPADSNIPLGPDIIGMNLDDQFRLIKSVVRDESVNKSWERWRGLYGTLTYIDPLTFTLSGNQLYPAGPGEAGRRIKATCSAGDVEGYIQSVTFDGVTTTCKLLMDGTATLDNGLTEVQFGVVGDALPWGVGPNAPLYGVATGQDDYLVSIPIQDYVVGQEYRVRFMTASTGPVTININGLGAKQLIRANGTQVGANDVYAGSVMEMVYNGTQMQAIGVTAGSGTGVLIPIGDSGQNATAIGTANSQSGSVGTPANMVETDLFKYTFPGRGLVKDGQYLYIQAAFQVNGQVNNRIRLYFGSTVVYEFLQPFSAEARACWIHGWIVRAGATLQRSSASFVAINTDVHAASMSEDMTQDIVIRLTGKNGANVANAIVANIFIVQYGS